MIHPPYSIRRHSLFLTAVVLINVIAEVQSWDPPPAGSVCSPPIVGSCLSTSGYAIISYTGVNGPAETMATCCAACLANSTCVAWQTRIASKVPVCDLLSTPILAAGTTCNHSRVVPIERVNRTQTTGVYVQHGDPRTLLPRGFLVGGDLVMNWADIEPSDGVFDWSTLYAELVTANNAELYLLVQLQTGPDAPTWIFDRTPPLLSVKKVKITADPGHKQPVFFPYYADPTYSVLFLRMQSAFATYLASLPLTLSKRINSVQAMFGSTGDDTPWHGSANPGGIGSSGPAGFDYEMRNGNRWDDFKAPLIPQLCDIFSTSRGGNITIPILWNLPDTVLQGVLNGGCPGSVMKLGMQSHGFQITGEIDDYNGKGMLCHQEGISCRGEDWPFPAAGSYIEAPVWHEYWHLMYNLYFGIDRPNLSQPPLDNPANFPAYNLFNKYSTSIRPPASDWVGAIIALRDGLDGLDTVRFNTTFYGTPQTLNRNAAIIAAFANRGAKQGDPSSANSGAMKSRSPSSMNDVGLNITSGNWGNDKAIQLAPSETSIGWWRVGPTSSPYGRFARGFEMATNKTSMSFVLDTRLWGGLPITTSSARVPLRLRLVYFDAGGGSLSIVYDSAGGCKTASTVAVSTASVASGTWSELSLDLADGYLGRRCGPRGADIILSSTADTIVHGFEIYAVSPSFSPARVPAPARAPATTTLAHYKLQLREADYDIDDIDDVWVEITRK